MQCLEVHYTVALTSDVTNTWYALMTNVVKYIRQIPAKHQRKPIRERTAATPVESQNTYQPNSIVLWIRNETRYLLHKLDVQFQGPYKWLSRNALSFCLVHLLTAVIQYRCFVAKFSLRVGPSECHLGQFAQDLDQYVITAVCSWNAGPVYRRDIKFGYF